MQLLVPLPLANRPAGQPVQDASPVAPLYVPGEHVEHTVEPVVAAICPTAHGVHETEAVTLAY